MLETAPTATAVRVEVRDPDYTPELQGRLGKLEAAISKQRTVRFQYWSIARDDERERTINPYALLPENGTWYVIGLDLEDNIVKSFRVSRIRSEIRFATRRERDFRVPESFDVEEFRGRAEWQFGDIAGEARIEVAPDTAWWVTARVRRRAQPGRGRRVRHRVRLAAAARALDPPPGGPRRPARALPAPPPRHRGSPRRPPRARRAAADARPPSSTSPGMEHASDRQAGPVAPERFGVLQSLLAYLLAACGEERDAVIPAGELIERFSIPAEALEEHLSLLNLVNFGGGCYAVYAELHGDEVHVDKELFGDTFRRAPRLTPLEARAIRLALEFVGPMIAAGSSSPLDRVRAKLEEAFGQFDLAQTPTPQAGAEEDMVAHAHPRDRPQPARRARVPEARVDRGRDAHDRALRDRAPPAALVRPHLGRRPRRAAQLPARPHADGEAAHDAASRRARASTPRELHKATSARIWYSPEVGRWEVEKGARPLVDGAALSERPVGSAGWLVGEVLSFRGEAVVLEPPELRELVATRRASSSAASARAARTPRPHGGASRLFGSAASSVKVEPSPGVELTSSVPPCASAIARAM